MLYLTFVDRTAIRATHVARHVDGEKRWSRPVESRVISPVTLMEMLFSKAVLVTTHRYQAASAMLAHRRCSRRSIITTADKRRFLCNDCDSSALRLFALFLFHIVNDCVLCI